jgi:hypothetical protein
MEPAEVVRCACSDANPVVLSLTPTLVALFVETERARFFVHHKFPGSAHIGHAVRSYRHIYNSHRVHAGLF